MKKRAKVIIVIIFISIIVVSFFTGRYVLKKSQQKEKTRDDYKYAKDLEDKQVAQENKQKTQETKNVSSGTTTDNIEVLDKETGNLDTYRMGIKNKIYIGEYQEAINRIKRAEQSKNLTQEEKQELKEIEQDIALIVALENADKDLYSHIMKGIKNPDLYMKAFYVIESKERLPFIVDKSSLVPSLFENDFRVTTYETIKKEEIEKGSLYEFAQKIYDAKEIYKIEYPIEDIMVNAILGRKEDGSLYLYGIYSDSEVANKAFCTKEQLTKKM